MVPRLSKREAIGLEIDPFGIVPGRKLEGEDEKGATIVLTEKEWYDKLVKHTQELCKGKSGLESAYAILKDIEAEIGRPNEWQGYQKGGALGIRYQKSPGRREGSFRGIDVFAKKRGDCDEVSYLFCMMARAVGLKAHIADVELTRIEKYQALDAGHVIAAVFLNGKEMDFGKGDEYQQLNKWTGYPPGERKKTFEKLGLDAYGDTQVVLMDAVSHKIEHFHSVTIKSDREAMALHYSELSGPLIDDNKYTTALKMLEKAKELDPSLDSIYINLGNLFAKQMSQEKNPKKAQDLFYKAETNFQKAMAMDPNSLLNLHNLGTLYLKRGLLDKAETFFKKSLDLSGRASRYAYTLTAHIQLGLIYLEKGYDKTADDEFKEALYINPGLKLELTYKRGEIYYKTNRFEQAIELFNEITSKDDQSIRNRDKFLCDSIFMLGKCYLGQGKLKEALESFERYAKLDPNWNEVDMEKIKEANEHIKEISSKMKVSIR
ncbi:MAG: tetratricopeptide repeat protein [Candidatus Micrarchaeota archaeon]